VVTKALKSISVVVAALWVGGLFWVGFVFAPYLFILAARKSPIVPHTGAAADLIGPLLYGSDVIGLVVATALLVVILVLRRRQVLPLGGRVYLSELALGAAFLCACANYWLFTPRLKTIQRQLDQVYGGFYLADRADPLFLQFNRVHEASTTIFTVGFVAALLVLCCLSQFRARATTATGLVSA
jgi:hypothetical protein